MRVSDRDFTEKYESFLNRSDPENYDAGDAIWDAEQDLGFEPYEVSQHAGLMALTRAISLSEVTMARMAAACFVEARSVVFVNGKVWARAWEESFYKTCLITPFNTSSNGFGALRELRDIYVHGYGIPTTDERRNKLAGRLHREFGDAEPTAQEMALGYEGTAYYFGRYAKYSPQTQRLESEFFFHKSADLSPLSTYRSLTRIGMHIKEAHAAVEAGVRDDITLENCKFARIYDEWDKRQANSQSSRSGE